MRYELTTPKIDGSLLLEFDDDSGVLVQYNLNANLTTDQQAWLGRCFPVNRAILDNWLVAGIKFVLEEVPEQPPTFDQFYAAYPKREHRLKAEKAWEKLTETERRLAIKYLKRYRYILHSEPWRSPLLPGSYLNGKVWND